MDFPGGSDGKLSVYNARDLDLIPGENEYEMPRNLLDSSCRYCVQSLQSCLTLCDPMDYSPPGSSVDGILQARILEWVAVPSPGHLPNLGTEPRSPTLQADS